MKVPWHRALCALLLAAAGTAAAHSSSSPPPSRVLGELRFPTTTKSAPAQAAFTEGMLYLHIFEYPSAALAFQRAQALDPGFAMAYWGEAMSYTHPVWNQQDLEGGRAALAKLGASAQVRAAKAGDARERDFLRAAEILYGEGDKQERDQALLAQMEAMAKRYPRDDEVQLFLALALLGADEGKRDLPRFLRAAQIAKAVYRHNPKHPGAAHYWIHGMDDPQHAAGALEAAHALAKIAPDAGHSQHMTSHIFIALGRWQDVVDANVAAMRVVDADLAGKQQPPYECGHYSEWLQYAWLQQGREDEAIRMLGQCERTGNAAVAWMRAHPGVAYLNAPAAERLQESLESSVAHMRAIALVDAPAHRAALLESMPPAGKDAGVWFASGLAALQSDRPEQARRTLAAMQATLADARAKDEDVTYRSLMARMLEGAILAREDKIEAALALLRETARDYDALPFDFGPPATVKPPHELLGEVLLAAGRREEAKAEFQRALASAPARHAALVGRSAAATPR